jgi:hypothetical protein
MASSSSGSTAVPQAVTLRHGAYPQPEVLGDARAPIGDSIVGGGANVIHTNIPAPRKYVRPLFAGYFV